MKQLYPSEPQGNLARHLNTLAGMVTGIVLGKSCQLPILAESRSKRFSRWLQNETVTARLLLTVFEADNSSRTTRRRMSSSDCLRF